MEEMLVYFACKYEGDYQKIYQALKNKELVDEKLKRRYLEQLKCKYTTILSKDYPSLLKEIRYPPVVLFYYGDISLLEKKTIGVIGMRHPSSYGIRSTQSLVHDLVCNDYVIVSGMAIGIDSIAHRSAISNGGKTAAVLGGGIDFGYPKSNHDIYKTLKKEHCVLSEIPFAKAPVKSDFRIRNRLIAGLSQQILVCEAKEQSGTMITVGYALEQGKDIFAVPCSIDGYQGTNMLINQGAKLVVKGQDMAEELRT